MLKAYISETMSDFGKHFMSFACGKTAKPSKNRAKTLGGGKNGGKKCWNCQNLSTFVGKPLICNNSNG